MKTLTTCFFTFTIINLLAQTSAVNPEEFGKTITAADLKAHLLVLADPGMEGRETGTPGGQKAADYIAGQFQKMSVPAVGDNNTWFQKMYYSSESWSKVALEVRDKSLSVGKDFYAFPGRNSGDIELKDKKILFLGYGIDDPKYSDYKNQQVAGKVLLIYDGEPTAANGNFLITGSNVPSEWTSNWTRKVATARQKGAKALLIIDANFADNLAKARRSFNAVNFGPAKSNPDHAAHCYISPETARLIGGNKYSKVLAAVTKINSTGVPNSVKINCPVELTLDKHLYEISGNNVLGYVEGSDPLLKDELIIISAHYDHLGKKGTEIWHGADDNASGTSGVLEICQAFAEAKKKGAGPRRSILCMLLTGEEKGLWGSKYYTLNPIFPLERTVANVNIDMIGRVDEKHKDNPAYIYVIGSDRLSTDLHRINETANSTYTRLELDYTYNAPNDPNRYYYRSDHYNFAEKGIPAIFFFSGTHPDYHKPTDTADKIDFDKMEKISRLAFYTAWELANRDKRIVVDGKN